VLIPTKYQHTAIFQMKEIELETEQTLPQYVPQDDIFLSIVHVALKIRGDMMETPGHKGLSVSEDETRGPSSGYSIARDDPVYITSRTKKLAYTQGHHKCCY